MVLIIEEFDLIKQAMVDLPNARLLYKLDQHDGRARLRVKLGTLAMDRWYAEDNEELMNILDFMNRNRAVIVKEQRLDEIFFM